MAIQQRRVPYKVAEEIRQVFAKEAADKRRAHRRKRNKRLLLAGVGLTIVFGLFSRLGAPTDELSGPPVTDTSITSVDTAPPVDVLDPITPPGAGGSDAPGAGADSPYEPLTPAEKSLISAFFGDQIDVDQMRFHHHAERGATVTYDGDKTGQMAAHVSDGTTIHIWGSDNRSEDYSGESDAFLFGTFIHEAVHIWQYQTGNAHTNMHPSGKGIYSYAVEDGLVFSDYGPEQQAAMIEDYVRTFLHDSGETRWLKESYGDQAKSKEAGLASIVETQFPGAQQLRLARQAAPTAPSTAPPAATGYGS